MSAILALPAPPVNRTSPVDTFPWHVERHANPFDPHQYLVVDDDYFVVSGHATEAEAEAAVIALCEGLPFDPVALVDRDEALDREHWHATDGAPLESLDLAGYFRSQAAYFKSLDHAAADMIAAAILDLAGEAEITHAATADQLLDRRDAYAVCC